VCALVDSTKPDVRTDLGTSTKLLTATGLARTYRSAGKRLCPPCCDRRDLAPILDSITPWSRGNSRAVAVRGFVRSCGRTRALQTIVTVGLQLGVRAAGFAP